MEWNTAADAHTLSLETSTLLKTQEASSLTRRPHCRWPSNPAPVPVQISRRQSPAVALPLARVAFLALLALACSVRCCWFAAVATSCQAF